MEKGGVGLGNEKAGEELRSMEQKMGELLGQQATSNKGREIWEGKKANKGLRAGAK